MIPARNTPLLYGYVARAFHWSMALLVIFMLALGLYMDRVATPPDSYALYGWHKSFGLVILALVALRVVWRQMNTIPLLPGDIPRWQRWGAHASHAALYALMIAMPLIGWAMSSAGGHAVSLFGMVTLPPLVEKDKALGSLLNELHTYGAYALIGVIGVHVLAALYHHFIRKDFVLRRMLPW